MKSKIISITLGIALFSLTALAWFKPANDFSFSERRVLAQPPVLNTETVISGEFMSSFETYALDQFPMRDGFRTLKSAASLGVFRMGDTNDLYLKDGHISKIEYPLNTQMLDHAAERFSFINSTYLGASKVYFSIVPDKHYFLNHGKLSLSYSSLVSHMREKTQYAKYINLFDILSVSDYYRTDSHWKQEKLMPVAERLGQVMGFTPGSGFAENTLPSPFYGVYAGQLALPVKPDSIKYLTSDVLDACTLTSYDTGKPEAVAIYDMESAVGRDPYEMFMSGSDALLVLENPNAEKRELVIFRDSFASSLTPLLAQAYSKITLVDIRYIQPAMLRNFVSFEGADVLFLYSTSLLNSSLALK